MSSKMLFGSLSETGWMRLDLTSSGVWNVTSFFIGDRLNLVQIPMKEIILLGDLLIHTPALHL